MTFGEVSRKDSERVSERGGAPRVAASSYLNTAPLIWSFARGRRRGEVELLTDTAPARCADMLALSVESRPSAALVEVVCREFLGRAPRLEQAEPNLEKMLARHDAALVI